jgi:hypothetical protein
MWTIALLPRSGVAGTDLNETTLRPTPHLVALALLDSTA